MLSINLSVDTPPSHTHKGPTQVGWFVDEPKGSLLYAPPKRVSIRPPNKDHPKSAARCPAVLQMETRYFQVPCPFDMRIGFERDPKTNKPHLVNRLGANSPVRANKLADLIVLVNENEWRFPDRPTVQMKLPYMFISDEPCWMTQLDAFMHYRPAPLPGTIFGGRMPIHVWPRPLMWGFEWHDTTKDLILKRGEPLFYVQFETQTPDRPVVLIEAEKTPELESYIDAISGVVNYVNQTFSLFSQAEEIRPQSLLKKKDKGRDSEPTPPGCPVDHS